eukprot:Pompholyxophrys_punicea_v1_NODE_155_length_3151_cov_4.974483.p1 type:complete len:402 gc:universal NODE_155_length_3151_cov_4.974483:1287-82(-)
MESFDQDELAQVIVSTLMQRYLIPKTKLFAFVHDRASVYYAAIRIVKVLFPGAIDVGCLSHTLDNAGALFDTPHLNHFTTLWNGICSHSLLMRKNFAKEMGESKLSHSRTRWWSLWEVQSQVFKHWEKVKTVLLNEDSTACKNSRKNAFEYLQENEKDILLQLAIVMDVGEPLILSTYLLEADIPLVFHTYDILLEVKQTFRIADYLNVSTIVERYEDSPQARKRLSDETVARADPVTSYFDEKIFGELSEQFKMFKIARFLCPTKVNYLKPTKKDVEEFSCFPFENKATLLQKMVDELPTYLALADGFKFESEDEYHQNKRERRLTIIKNEVFGILKWWKQQKTQLPTWFFVVRQLMLLQPSSAASERVFSLLNNSFSDKQTASLEDYREAAIMLQYNKR